MDAEFLDPVPRELRQDLRVLHVRGKRPVPQVVDIRNSSLRRIDIILDLRGRVTESQVEIIRQVVWI